MRCITLTQPWATLVAVGAKRIETRNWSTAHRGPLAIHAAISYGRGGKRGFYSRCQYDPFKSALEPHLRIFEHYNCFAAPLGAIVATCELLDCVPTVHPGIANEPGKPWFTGVRKGVGPHYYEVPPPLDSNEYAFGDYSAGRFAWLLGYVKALPEPIPCKGQLGLFNLPSDIAKRLESGR